MKKFFLSVLFAFIVVPFNVCAEELEVIAKVEKYYKTTIVDSKISNYTFDNTHYFTTTEEVTEEEYNSFNGNSITPLSLYGYVETNYKKLKR